MTAGMVADDPRVGELIKLCRALRKGGGKRPRYTEPIKDLVRQLVQSGDDVGAVAESCGITPQAARKWLKPGVPPRAADVQVLRVEPVSPQPNEHRRALLTLKTGEIEVVIYPAAKGVA